MEENIALARRFLLEHFVSRGMVVDFAVHVPDVEPGGISNPHFHVMSPIRSIDHDGSWGCKQYRVYELDEEGNRLLDTDGNYIFNAVPTTDWGSPETLEYWREQWAVMCNAKFEELGCGERIDHRSYERQGIDLLPTIHEGPAVRQMEAEGIRTDKGEFNRWIKATNSLIQSIRKKIAALLDWLKNVADGLRNIKFTKAREKYKAEHKTELNQFYAANRLLTKYCPDGKYNSKAIRIRYAELEQQHDAVYADFKDLREESQILWKTRSHIDAALKARENTQNHEQTI